MNWTLNWSHRPPWVITVLALLFSAGVLLILALQLNQSYKAAENQARIATETEAELLESQINSTLAQVNLIISEIGNRVSEAELSGTPLSEEREKNLQGMLLDKLTLIRQASNLALISASGETTHEALDLPGKHLSLPADEIINIRNNRFISTIYLATQPESKSLAPSLLIIKRMENEYGEFAGLVVASISSQYFAKLFAANQLGQHAVLEVIDEQGQTIAALNNLTHQTAALPFKLSPAMMESTPVKGENKTLTEQIVVSQGARMVSYRHIDATPLNVLVSSASIDYLAKWRSSTLAYLVGGTTLLFLSMMMSYFFWRSHRLARSLRTKEFKLQASENRFRQVIETTPVALILARLPDYYITYINKEAAQLFNLPQAAALSMRAFDFFQDRVQFLDLAFYAQRNDPAHNVEIILKRHDGLPLWATLSLSTVAVSDQNLLIIGINDITERKRLEDELQRRATTDSLSGLANRAHFMDRGEHELERARRYGHCVSLMMLDIDFFKHINDSFGHAAGDQVIQSIALLARTSIREIDLLGRMGGEEFAILLPETSLEQTKDAAERLRHDIEQHTLTTTEGQHIQFTVSIGIASLGESSESISDLLKKADKALYEAKHLGRNRVCLAPLLERNPDSI